MKKIAAIYARVSSDRQKEQNTIASQTALLLEHAQAQGWTVPTDWVFEDEGHSGSTLARPGLERLRDLAAEGQIEAVLVYAPDRLSRNYAYQVLLLEEFSRHGVQTLFLKSGCGQTPEEKLLLQFQGMIAEYERAQIAERSRRGKKHRAKAGYVSVLSKAPYGYRYVKKTEHSEAFYEVVPAEAEVVRQIFDWYTRELCSLGVIRDRLLEQKNPTRTTQARWERSTLWAMLRNPAYQGTACFGKTERCVSQRITRRSRQKGKRGPNRSSQARARQEWIEIPVPALISREAFALAQERLAQNKQRSLRNTKEPALLQGLLICAHCGYSLYRTSTHSSKGKLRYYRCAGRDRDRHGGRMVCSGRPIRLEYLDQLVWNQVLQLLRTPELIEAELDRRRQEHLESSPAPSRKEQLESELTRVKHQTDKLLDAYQEDLLSLAELRLRMPELKKRLNALEVQREQLSAQAMEDQRWSQLRHSVKTFLEQLNQTAEKLDTSTRQKILRLLIKQILVGKDAITVQHSIPVSPAGEGDQTPSYRLCTRRLCVFA